jgi:hypothetical protein
LIEPDNRKPALKIKLPDFALHLRGLPTVLLLAGAATLLGACTGIRTLATNSLAQLTAPEPIRVPKGHQAVLEAQGRGNLLYECQAIKRAPFEYSWLLQNTALKLEDSRGQSISYLPGTRARWIHSDGSSVSAREFVQVPSNGKNLPLARATAEMSAGTGVLDKVSYIQTLKTVGGVVTSPVCTAGNLGMRVSVPYESEFVFWRPAP